MVPFFDLVSPLPSPGNFYADALGYELAFFNKVFIINIDTSQVLPIFYFFKVLLEVKYQCVVFISRSFIVFLRLTNLQVFVT